MRRILTLVTLCLLATTTAALAQPSRPAPRPRPPVEWDARGWVLLGEQEVSGRVDKDRIRVGRYEGRFNKLTLRVLDSDLELLDFTIVFADNSQYSPKLAHYFREGQRTRQIELPPTDGVIRHIELRYRNLPGGGRARVQVYGFKIGDAGGGPGPRPPVRVDWDSRGWTMLGSRDVDGRVDRDRIQVGRYEGRFSKLTIVVRDSDLEMIDFAIKFGRGPAWRPSLKHYFRENQRTRVIDLPGDDRVIKHIDFTYRNLPGGGRAKVEVWAWRSDGPGMDRPSVPVRPAAWRSDGWTMLGEQVVDGRRRGDRDTIRVGRYQGKFRRLTVVVLDSDLEMIDMQVNFGRGRPFSPGIKQYFREDTRTRVIDLPGDDRVIRTITFRYRNLPGGGRARVQVWGQ